MLRRQALASGLTTDEIDRLLRSGTWTSVRRGAYAVSATWRTLSEEQRHLARAAAIMLKLDEGAVLSHGSAALAHGLPLWQVPLDTVHVTRGRVATPRIEAAVQHHVAALPDGHVTDVGGFRATALARTVVDLSRRHGFRSGLVAADAALHQGLSPKDLLQVSLLLSDWPGARDAGRVVSFADGRAESPGESLCRVDMRAGGLPEPVLQAVITLPNGRIARVDFLFPEQWTIVEFDGRVKYGVPPGTDPDEAASVLWQEKLREDGLREAGYEVVRITWADLAHPERLAARIRAAFERAARSVSR